MKIIGLFCGTTATNNEEYRKVLKRRNIWMAALALAGIVIAGAALLAHGTRGCSSLNIFLASIADLAQELRWRP